MIDSYSLEGNVASAAAGVIVGVVGMLGTLKSASRGAQAVEYGAMVKRLTELEARADLMGETIFKKDRQLITAEQRLVELEVRYSRLEHAFDELLKRTRMPGAERERLQALYKPAPLVFSTKEKVNEDDDRY
jgi:hypothetical protein